MDAERLQSGYFTGALWIDDASFAEESLGQIAGLVFGGFPPICLIGAPLLTVNPVPPPEQLPCTVSVYARGGPATTLWSTAAPPPTVLLLDPLRDFLAGEFTLSVGGSQLSVVALDVAALNSARDYRTTPGIPWDGRFAFHLHTRTANGTALLFTANAELLSADVSTRVFTGIETPGPFTRVMESRPDLCPICGDETFRETWIWCGYHEQLECPRCADPGLGEDPQRDGTGVFHLVGED